MTTPSAVQTLVNQNEGYVELILPSHNNPKDLRTYESK